MQPASYLLNAAAKNVVLRLRIAEREHARGISSAGELERHKLASQRRREGEEGGRVWEGGSCRRHHEASCCDTKNITLQY